MRMNEALTQAKQASFEMERQMWVWIEGNDFRFDVAIPKGQRLFARVIGDELWRWDGNALTVERI